MFPDDPPGAVKGNASEGSWVCTETGRSPAARMDRRELPAGGDDVKELAGHCCVLVRDRGGRRPQVIGFAGPPRPSDRHSSSSLRRLDLPVYNPQVIGSSHARRLLDRWPSGWPYGPPRLTTLLVAPPVSADHSGRRRLAISCFPGSCHLRSAWWVLSTRTSASSWGRRFLLALFFLGALALAGFVGSVVGPHFKATSSSPPTAVRPVHR